MGESYFPFFVAASGKVSTVTFAFDMVHGQRVKIEKAGHGLFQTSVSVKSDLILGSGFPRRRAADNSVFIWVEKQFIYTLSKKYQSDLELSSDAN